MNQPEFTIQTDEIDVTALVDQIRKNVADKKKSGAYSDSLVAVAERSNLTNLKDDEEFITYYLECMSRSSVVGIREFEIPDAKGGAVGKAMQKFKKAIWSCLKFYTYRMWTQQNQVNSLQANGIQVIQSQQLKKAEALQARIDRLEAALVKAGIELPDEK